MGTGTEYSMTGEADRLGGLTSVPVWLPRMPHIGHRHHLCNMAESGDVTLAQMKALVKNPKFICKTCGRVAANEENLCEPVDL